MRIDFEYSKWADQADRKRAFADMTFNAKMHCELQRMSTCRELAKIGQYHERGASTSAIRLSTWLTFSTHSGS